MPPLQSALQQSAFPRHAVPFGSQQLVPVQSLLQQSLLLAQLFPFGWQQAGAREQTAAAGPFWQQSAEAKHLAPFAAQQVAVVESQRPVQQSLSLVHATVTLSQHAPPTQFWDRLEQVLVHATPQ